MEAWNVKFTVNGGKIETKIVVAKRKKKPKQKYLTSTKTKK